MKGLSLVTLLSKSNCPGCKLTKKVLNQKGVPFEERMMDEDESAIALAKELGFLQAPVVIPPEGAPWSGFRPDKINALAA